MTTTLCSEITAAIAWLVYACFFEWVAHRFFMHQPRGLLRDAFRGHMEHHKHYRGDHRFQAEEGELPGGVALRWYAFPAILLGHLPVFLLFEWLTGLPTTWGAVLACATYFAGYEYTHYLMHVPLGHPIERLRWFRFMREHHRIHHERMRCNFNVFIPFADLCLGTLRTAGRGGKAESNARR